MKQIKLKSIQAITKDYQTINPKLKKRSAIWYDIANLKAEEISNKHKVCFAKVCGVISALSPMNEWNNNLAEAEKLIFMHINQIPYTEITFKTFLSNVGKATQILDLEEPCPNEISKILYGKVGYKTYNFFWNIYQPNDENFVTIDRHMLTYFGKEVITSKRMYDKMKQRLIDASNKLGLIPQQLQAILWVYTLEMKKSDRID